jgi:macrolide transport system ATP-binding/permease protein
MNYQDWKRSDLPFHSIEAWGSVYSLVLREAGRLIAIGMVVGLLCSGAGATMIRKLLFGTQPWGASTLGAIAVSLTIFAMLPARRAASV